MALSLMEKDDISANRYFEEYPNYRQESLHITREAVKKCHEVGRSYILLQADDSEELEWGLTSDASGNNSAVRVFRSEAPEPGTKALVSLPEGIQ